MSRYLFVFLLVLATRSLLADDFKTIDGKEYKNVTVSRVELDGIVLISSSGISKVYFTELPKEVQERFHYDAAKARAYSAEQAANYAASQKQQEEVQKKREEAAAKYNAYLAETQKQKEEAAANLAEAEAAKSQATNIKLLPDPNPASVGCVFMLKVISITNGGSEAVGIVESIYGIIGPKPGTAVYVYGDFSQAVDGDTFRFEGTNIGRVQYRTANGGMATVLAFRSKVN